MKEREPGGKPVYMGSEGITICCGNEGGAELQSWTE